MQLQLVFKLNHPVAIPFNYNYQVQSAVYFKLREVNTSEFWHDSGYGEAKRFKAFVFGQLHGRYTVVDRHMVFSDSLALEVRSPVFEFTDMLQRSFELNPGIKLFDTLLGLESMQLGNVHINSRRVTFATASPMVVHKTCDDGRTLYYSPEDAEFIPGLESNFRNKYEAIIGETPGEMRLRFVGSSHKTVTRYKGIWINAYGGMLEAEGDCRYLEFVYNSGLGAKNPQGFGMVNVIK